MFKKSVSHGVCCYTPLCEESPVVAECRSTPHHRSQTSWPHYAGAASAALASSSAPSGVQTRLFGASGIVWWYPSSLWRQPTVPPVFLWQHVCGTCHVRTSTTASETEALELPVREFGTFCHVACEHLTSVTNILKRYWKHVCLTRPRCLMTFYI